MYREYFLVSAFVVVSLACACGRVPPTDNQKFCDADFVATFKIWDKKNADAGTIMYLGVAEQVFKTNGLIQSGSNINIRTNSHVEGCGVTWLETGKVYLLSGNREVGALGVSACQQLSATEWSEVPEDIKDALKNGKYKHCQ
ncbi:hypothetical protein L596_026633 [Steinernema carpocapsae]|uniref:NTR domain-containing protein n=1 Tax=Steinernema carpocapsae TaxID=34508 RepID=A0A4U5M234_STECR|nr:hypothetical protein L596_026633 [Steinernema carpocapsae]